LIKNYYYLTKPGIIYGNAITAIAGFLFASKGHIDFRLLAITIIGISLVIASACVFNNYVDRKIDKLMDRTKQRALITGKITKLNALIFGSSLGLIGFLILWHYVNSLVAFIGVFAFIDYVILYGLSKRESVHGTLVGSLAGAAPILAGYCAVTNQIDGTGLILFIILLTWQMPHFYAIAIKRLADYKRAKLPMLPVVKGINYTQKHILFYIIIFTISIISLNIFSYASNIYLITMAILCLIWIAITVNDSRIKKRTAWANGMFHYSLIVLLIFSILISINPWL
jgi:protoheme IX farnesyltransferase